MKTFERLQRDVLVVGTGCAGLIAALEAEAEGAEVAIIDRGPIGIGTNSALSGGAFAGPKPHYSTEQYVMDTLQAGKGINCESLVRLMAEEAPLVFSLLRSLGLELAEFNRVHAVKSPRSDLNPGVTLMKVLSKKARNLRGMSVLNGFYVTEIVKDGEKVSGVKGLVKTGEEVCISAPAVVLATGGAGAIYLKNDNQKGIMGQGYCLAAKAGLELWDMEFVQFYPFVMAEPGLFPQLVFPPFPQEARLVNTSGEDVLRKNDISDLSDAVIKNRDRVSAILFREGLEGPVAMDYRKVPTSNWKRHPLSLLEKMRFDFRRKPFIVSPAAHFFMGGVRIDEKGQTTLPGLFACGEVAWGLHGANRMGGNALTECVVFGRIAGRNAARYALTHRVPPLYQKKMLKGFSPVPSPARGRLAELRRGIREIAWRYAGVVRSERGLREGLAKLAELEIELKEIAPQTVREGKLKEDLMSAAFVLKGVLTASLSRKETRGAFCREDFPQQDDLQWRKNSCLAYNREKNQFSLSYYPK